MVLLESEQFLTELTRLFQKCRLSGSVFITLKKCKQLSTRQGREEAGRPSDAPAWVPRVWEPGAESVAPPRLPLLSSTLYWAQSWLRDRRMLEAVAGAARST